MVQLPYGSDFLSSTIALSAFFQDCLPGDRDLKRAASASPIHYRKVPECLHIQTAESLQPKVVRGFITERSVGVSPRHSGVLDSGASSRVQDWIGYDWCTA